jgi:exopolyphosphatase/guanosine-5'-triphosphate,3'-diphosphate pyrophosphatase
MACATSAMREAANGKQLAESIEQKTGIAIQIIDGGQEADIIYSNHIAERLDPSRQYLYVDVGGGSTEITIIHNGVIADAQSFNIGTVRLLKDLVHKGTWKEMKLWLKQHTAALTSLEAIGSGGNINKIFSLSRKKTGVPITYAGMMQLYQQLLETSYEDRVRVLGLKADRADVIVPAAQIYTSVMKWSKIRKMHVPQIGLADGIIHMLYEKYKREALNF